MWVLVQIIPRKDLQPSNTESKDSSGLALVTLVQERQEYLIYSEFMRGK